MRPAAIVERLRIRRGHVLGLGRQGQLPQNIRSRKVASPQAQWRQPFAVTRVTFEHQLHGLADEHCQGDRNLLRTI